MKGSDRNVYSGGIRLLYRYNNLAFTDYLTVDYLNSNREPVEFSKFARQNPYHRIRNEHGEVTRVMEEYYSGTTRSYVFNPVYDMGLNHLNNEQQFGIRNNFEVEWSILKELKAKMRFGLTKSQGKRIVFLSPKHSAFMEKAQEEQGSFEENNRGLLNYDGDLNVTYGKLLADKHMVNVVGGVRLTSTRNSHSGYSVSGFIDDRYISPVFSRGYAAGAKPSYFDEERRSASFYVNSGYSYQNKYLFDFNLRSDGASVFGVDRRFTTTWAIGIGWNMHNESYMKAFDWLNTFKLRFSIGNPGNQNFDPYISKNIYRYDTRVTNPFGIAAVISQYGNRNLKWQKTVDRNHGVDIALWNSRVRLTLDYFVKNTDPLLLHIQLPTSSGASSSPRNLGAQIVEGMTGIANVAILRSADFYWNANLSARTIKYRYDKIGNSLEELNKRGRSRNLTRYYDGGSQTAVWAVPSLGIDPATGREIFRKKDGSQTFLHDYEDEVIVGNTTPKVEGVFGTSLYYKGFTASVNFRYRLGGQVFLRTLYNKVENISSTQLRFNQDRRALHDRWQSPGDESSFKSISLTDQTPLSSRFVADENTLAAESVSLGYETQAEWLKKAGVSSLNLRAYMNDIFRISGVKEERGLDYPFARSVSFSVGLTF